MEYHLLKLFECSCVVVKINSQLNSSPQYSWLRLVAFYDLEQFASKLFEANQYLFESTKYYLHMPKECLDESGNSLSYVCSNVQVCPVWPCHCVMKRTQTFVVLHWSLMLLWVKLCEINRKVLLYVATAVDRFHKERFDIQCSRASFLFSAGNIELSFFFNVQS